MRWILAVEVVPSPKLHFHAVGDPVLLSVNATFNGAFPEVGDAVKLQQVLLTAVTFI